ncbi:MAG: ROK family protein [Vulcanimicrobiota bacterium]
MDNTLVIGVDLGGTHAYAGVVNTSGEVLLRKETDIDTSLDADVIIKQMIVPTIKSAIEEKKEFSGRIKAVGLGAPGSHDSKRGICHFSPNFRWRNVEVTRPIEEELGIPVYMLNDVRTAALGEKHFGAGKDVSDFVIMAIGTGIGGGVVLDKRLILGVNEVAGEIGHITVDPDGHQCNCGNYGCMEAMASGPNIARRGREAMLENRDSKLWNMVEHINDVSARTLYDAARNEDTTALKVWEDTGRYLGIGMASIVHTVNPQRFIIGGRVATAIDFFLPSLKEELNARATMVPRGSIEVVSAVLKENAGLVGSAALAFEKIEVL